MGEHEGYVFVFRQLLDSEEWGLPPGQRCVMLTAILMSAWRDERVWANGKFFDVPRGSFISSSRAIAERAHVSHKIARGAIANLQRSGFLLSERLPGGAHEGTLYTVCKYCEYQDRAMGMGTPEGTACALLGQKKDEKGTPCALTCALGASPSIHKKEKKVRRKNTTVSGTSKAKKADPQKAPATSLLQTYYDHFRSSHGKPPVVSWAGADLNKAKQLLKGPPERNPEELEPYLKSYVRDADPFIAERGHPFALFPSRLQRYESGQIGLPGYSDDPDDEGWDLPEEERGRFGGGHD